MPADDGGYGETAVGTTIPKGALRTIIREICSRLKSWARRAVPRLQGFPSSPSNLSIWKRAVEVFGNEDMARKWLDTPLLILGESTPEQFSSSGDAAKQREILTILGRIDYGMFS